jgi:hypothetical protein
MSISWLNFFTDIDHLDRRSGSITAFIITFDFRAGFNQRYGVRGKDLEYYGLTSFQHCIHYTAFSAFRHKIIMLRLSFNYRAKGDYRIYLFIRGHLLGDKRETTVIFLAAMPHFFNSSIQASSKRLVMYSLNLATTIAIRKFFPEASP